MNLIIIQSTTEHLTKNQVKLINSVIDKFKVKASLIYYGRISKEVEKTNKVLKKRTTIIPFKANWNVHGKSAGYKRAKEMVGSADIVVYFSHDIKTHGLMSEGIKQKTTRSMMYLDFSDRK